MTKKSKVQLLQALQQHRTPVPKDLPQGLGLLPCTVTCWAAAAWQEVAPATNDATLHSSRGAAATRPTYAGFDVCIGDGTVHEGTDQPNSQQHLHLHVVNILHVHAAWP